MTTTTTMNLRKATNCRHREAEQKVAIPAKYIINAYNSDGKDQVTYHIPISNQVSKIPLII